VLATLIAASALLLAPIPPEDAFKLPSAKECVGARTLEVAVRTLPGAANWTRLTVRVNGKPVERVTNPRPARGTRLHDLPLRRFKLTLSARASDGRTATANRTYRPCPQGAKPKITIPDGPPPGTLVTRDLRVGTGATARSGKIAMVHYVMVTWSNRQAADSTWERGEAFEFGLGDESVIPGFDQGITGMRVGGRREIVVPPDLAYGDAGAPPAIAPDETLVFVVDLIGVRS
jgi:peptidylprolyl isomerase